MSFHASYKNTMAGARRIAQERAGKLIAGQPTPTSESAPAASREPESSVVAFVHPMRTITTRIAKEHGLNYADIIGKGRSHRAVAARFDAIAAVKNSRSTITAGQLGRIFQRDHTTILVALKKRGLA